MCKLVRTKREGECKITPLIRRCDRDCETCHLYMRYNFLTDKSGEHICVKLECIDDLFEKDIDRFYIAGRPVNRCLLTNQDFGHILYWSEYDCINGSFATDGQVGLNGATSDINSWVILKSKQGGKCE